MDDTNAIGVIDVSVDLAVPTTSCTSWERSHASTPVITTGGVRPLALAGSRRRGTAKGMDASVYTSFPSSGTSTSSPPV